MARPAVHSVRAGRRVRAAGGCGHSRQRHGYCRFRPGWHLTIHSSRRRFAARLNSGVRAMLKIFAVSAATIAAAAFGVAALFFSPTSCACLSPAQNLLLQANLDYSSTAKINDYSLDEIETSLNAALRGRKITPDDRYRRFLNCRSITQTEFECFDELARSKLFSRNYIVRITVDGQDNFQHATVRQYWAWL